MGTAGVSRCNVCFKSMALIAEPILFLLGPQARYICGSVIFVDGGHDAMFRPDQF